MKQPSSTICTLFVVVIVDSHTRTMQPELASTNNSTPLFEVYTLNEITMASLMTLRIFIPFSFYLDWTHRKIPYMLTICLAYSLPDNCLSVTQS